MQLICFRRVVRFDFGSSIIMALPVAIGEQVVQATHPPVHVDVLSYFARDELVGGCERVLPALFFLLCDHWRGRERSN